MMDTVLLDEVMGARVNCGRVTVKGHPALLHRLVAAWVSRDGATREAFRLGCAVVTDSWSLPGREVFLVVRRTPIALAVHWR